MSAASLPAEVTEAIYEVALAIEDQEARLIFLERSFQGDPAGLEEMASLLDASREAASFFVAAAEQRLTVASHLFSEIPDDWAAQVPEPVSQSEGPGAVVGRYRLLRRIGEGGCGIVYEAEQQESLRRRVAVKVIRMGMDTEAVVARFETERQALALMNHPNIARVLDAGATDAGRPYFVMELVDGEKITSYCDGRSSTPRERLALFLQVCQAIEHAHQKGIIHRDIKPSNILIADHAGLVTPKVIDFGIAKATEPQLGGGGAFTAHDQFIGTPAYMSPEQVDMAGRDVDTRSDVYSLGVLLHELLTGRTPFDAEELVSAGISEMRRTLLEEPLPLPSQALAARPAAERAEIAARRQMESPRLVSLIRGDLDWIVVKAMERNRNRRYQAVSSLALDVQRFLNNQPVSARPPRKLYLLERFFRRNRLAVILSVAFALSILGGLGAATMMYLRERRALIEQARLSRETETARAEEARLRRQAQARANISRGALLLSEGQVAEADALLRENPLVSIEPSLEAASVFRSLGNWNATYGRWEEAVQSYLLLNQAHRLGDPGKILFGNDLLLVGTALLEEGDMKSYRAFREDALRRYLPVRTPLQAEHLLKLCLLTPAGPPLMDDLKEAAEICRSGFDSRGGGKFYPAWAALSLALYELRAGENEKALDWGQRCLAMSEAREACKASTRGLIAISEARLGQVDRAREQVRLARDIVDSLAKSDDGELKPSRPYWYDWSVASILIREAEKELERQGR
ncbi:MAG: serine/threonine protein kinase [Akkermansiaceae bacterium]|nr:serine/threonine protein kinase [Akkermansiaceae bacterium]